MAATLAKRKQELEAAVAASNFAGAATLQQKMASLDVAAELESAMVQLTQRLEKAFASDSVTPGAPSLSATQLDAAIAEVQQEVNRAAAAANFGAAAEAQERLTLLQAQRALVRTAAELQSDVRLAQAELDAAVAAADFMKAGQMQAKLEVRNDSDLNLEFAQACEEYILQMVDLTHSSQPHS